MNLFKKKKDEPRYFYVREAINRQSKKPSFLKDIVWGAVALILFFTGISFWFEATPF